MDSKKLTDLCQEKLTQKYPNPRPVVQARLKYELTLIAEQGLSGKFLILAELAGDLRRMKIPFSAGGGRANGSLTLYVLGVTELDPLKLDLSFDYFFARALNGPGLWIWFDVPDQDYDEALLYAASKFGRETAKELLPGIDCVSNWFFTEGLLTLQRTADHILQDYGRQINIQAIPLDDAETFYLLSSGDTGDLYALSGILREDENINRSAIEDYPALLQGGDEIKKAITEFSPASFEELMIMVAMFNYDPLYKLKDKMLPRLIKNKHVRGTIAYPFPFLESILENTFGMLLYREQLHQIITEVSRFSVHRAELFLKHIMLGYFRARKVAEFQSDRGEFIKGGVVNGWSEEQLQVILSFIYEHVNTACIKANTANQTLLAYRMAYLKAHFL